MPLKKLKLPKVGKGCLASFYGSHIDEIVCVKQIGFGLAMALNGRNTKRNKMSSDFNFTVTS